MSYNNNNNGQNGPPPYQQQFQQPGGNQQGQYGAPPMQQQQQQQQPMYQQPPQGQYGAPQQQPLMYQQPAQGQYQQGQYPPPQQGGYAPQQGGYQQQGGYPQQQQGGYQQPPPSQYQQGGGFQQAPGQFNQPQQQYAPPQQGGYQQQQQPQQQGGYQQQPLVVSHSTSSNTSTPGPVYADSHRNSIQSAPEIENVSFNQSGGNSKYPPPGAAGFQKEPVNYPEVNKIPDPALLQANRPTSPVIWYLAKDKKARQGPNPIYSLPLTGYHADVEFHISTAFVRLNLRFKNTSSTSVDGVFALPLLGTVTSAEIGIGHSRIVETVVIPNGSVEQLTKDGPAQQEEIIPAAQTDDAFVPDLFRMPLQDIPAGETLSVTIEYIEPLDYVEGSYHFFLPMRFPAETFPQSAPINEIFKIRCTINSVTPQLSYDSDSHNLVQLYNTGYTYYLSAQHKANAPSDFHISYFMPSSTILGGLLIEPPSQKNYDPRGSFLLFVTPPTDPQPHFGRNIIFLIDRSGSMSGEPYANAAKALATALQGLGQGDRFNICSFDDRREYFSAGLVDVTPQSVADATRFVNSTQPRGLTDIRTPLIAAIDGLNAEPQKNSFGAPVVSTVVLLTDGCVSDEREICREVMEKAGNVRLLTFGIGKYCNWYFLKMLATSGRGFNSNVMYQEKIFVEIMKLMEKVAVPILTDVGLQMQVSDAEIYPFPIPDLFAGAPLVISGKYSGDFPKTINLVGTMGNGQPFAQEVVAASSGIVPVNKVFIKQRLDLLTSKAWLEDSKEIEEEVVAVSVAESYPTPYTTMVAYETTPEKKAEEAKKSEEEEKKDPKKKSNGNRKAAMAASMAIGGAVVIGAALYAFGDVGATMNGISAVASYGSDGITNLLSGNCCGDCFNLITCDGCAFCGDIGCGFCSDICGVCGEGFNWCGDCLGDLVGLVGDSCGQVCGCCGDAAGGAVDGVSGLCGNCGDLCGNLLGNCGQLCSTCGDGCGTVFSEVAGCCGESKYFFFLFFS